MGRQTKEHLYEVDLMRAFIILGVVCVHVISFFNLFAPQLSAVNAGYDMLLVALHFTRESFMFITGLVLFVTYFHKEFTVVDFWKKRFKLIFIPYAAWTLLYILFSGLYLKGFTWSFPAIMNDFTVSLLTGHQFYLYYLVISMQLYIVFPFFVRFMKWTSSHHAWLFAASLVLQIALMWFNKSILQNMSLAHLPTVLVWLIHYRDRNLLTYQFWFISGAIVAIHYQQIKAFILSQGKMIIASLGVALALLWVHYALDRFVLHQDETMSVLVLQPLMVPFGFMVTVSLWLGGMKWAQARLEKSMLWFSGFVKVAAAASFGVFLVHPLILHFVEVWIYQLHTTQWERIVMLPFAIAFIYGTAIVIVRIIARIPLVSYIVGQKSEPPRWMTGVSRAHSQ